MKLYFAGAESQLNILADEKVRRILISLANGYKSLNKIPELFNEYDLFLDSGAYTYSTKGNINIDEWIKKVLSLNVSYNIIANLDVINHLRKTQCACTWDISKIFKRIRYSFKNMIY